MNVDKPLSRLFPKVKRGAVRRIPAQHAYDCEVLAILAYEFPSSDPRESERRIKRRVRDKKLGQYDQARIDLLRRFKDAVQAEVHRGSESRYFTAASGLPGADSQRYVEFEDFDRVRMEADYRTAFPTLAAGAVRDFVGFAVFIYHLL